MTEPTKVMRRPAHPAAATRLALGGGSITAILIMVSAFSTALQAEDAARAAQREAVARELAPQRAGQAEAQPVKRIVRIVRRRAGQAAGGTRQAAAPSAPRSATPRLGPARAGGSGSRCPATGSGGS
ncbi:hypothetical protein [Streptomyces lavendofoliae]|uniref:hypothetical protein n=1 Tax=Streptomyces lavendofoliae TaxID=67314 RepID=UPI003D8E751F